MACTACLVCFIRNVNDCSIKKKPWKTGSSCGHITNLTQSILETFDIHDIHQHPQHLCFFCLTRWRTNEKGQFKVLSLRLSTVSQRVLAEDIAVNDANVNEPLANYWSSISQHIAFCRNNDNELRLLLATLCAHQGCSSQTSMLHYRHLCFAYLYK